MQLPSLQVLPSRSLAIFISLSHLGAILCVLIVSLSCLVKIALVLLCAISLVYGLNRHALASHPWAIMKLQPTARGTWILQAKNGKVHLANLRGDSLLTPFLVLLNFQQPGKRFYLWKKQSTVMLCVDNVEAESFRRLRRYLKLFIDYETNPKF